MQAAGLERSGMYQPSPLRENTAINSKSIICEIELRIYWHFASSSILAVYPAPSILLRPMIPGLSGTDIGTIPEVTSPCDIEQA